MRRRVHDVGKIFIPERVLNKPGPMSDDEFQLVRMHAHVGAEIVGTIPNSHMMREAIEHHHQRFDGSGYPDGLRGEEIPLWARIIGLTDAYANMVTEQSFAPARTPEQALDELVQHERHALRRHAGAAAPARTEVGAHVFRSAGLTRRLATADGKLETSPAMSIPLSLSGRVALISGGSRGIGASHGSNVHRRRR